MSRRRAQPPVAYVDPARARLPWFDAIWERLPAPSRRAFVALVDEPLDDDPILPRDVEPLLKQGLLQADGEGRPTPPDVRDFAGRIARLASAPVLFDTSMADLADTVAAVSRPDGLLGIALRSLVPADADPIDGTVRAITSPEWMRRMPPLIEQLPGVRRALGLLAAHMGLVSLQEWCAELGADAYPALDVLVGHLVVFEGLDPTTLRLMVGLLPVLRGEDAPDPADEYGVSFDLEDVGAFNDDDDLDDDDDDLDDDDDDEPIDAACRRLGGHPGVNLRVLRGASEPAGAPPAPQPAPQAKAKAKPARAKSGAKAKAKSPPSPKLPPPVARPAELDVTGPPRLLADLEALLVTLAERRVRVSNRGEVYVDDEAVVDEAFRAGGECRVVPVGIRRGVAMEVARSLELIAEVEGAGPRAPRLLRPAPDAGAFLAQPLAARWQQVVDHLRALERTDWLGGPLDLLAARIGGWGLPRERVLRLIEPITALQPGTFYELRALFDVFAREANPLLRLFVDRQAERGVVLDDWTPVLRAQLRYWIDDPDQRDPLAVLDRAFARGLRGLLIRLSLVGGVELGDVLGDRATLSLTPVGRYHLELDPKFPPVDEPAVEARIVVQPNLEVLVIGRAPRAHLALARLATPRPGESGPARTFTLSKDRVVDLVSQGLSPDGVVRALRDAVGGAEIPDNVTRTLLDWARAVRRARVEYVPVLVTDDEETALTIRSFAGKDTVVPGHVVPVNPAKLAAFKRALRQKGVIVDDDGPPDDRRSARRRRPAIDW